MSTIAVAAPRTLSRHILWVYLFLITAAEFVTSVTSTQLGLLFHVLILLGLMIHNARNPGDSVGRIALALTLAPLIRLLSLSMPLLSFPQMAWYPVVSIPLLIAMWIIVRQLGVPRRHLGLRRGNLLLQAMLVGSGFGLGAIEYFILHPTVLVGALSWQALLLPALSLTIFTGFSEEIIFRGLLQSLARSVLGRAAFLYVALLFGVLHIGYLSVIDVIFVFAVGLLFAYIVHWGGSILGVTLAHGLTNIMLFLIMPYLAQNGANPLATGILWFIIGGTTSALLATIILGVTWWRSPTASAPQLFPIATLRALRKSRGVSYAQLAHMTGLPLRELAAIEHGLRPITPQQHDVIVRHLAVIEPIAEQLPA